MFINAVIFLHDRDIDFVFLKKLSVNGINALDEQFMLLEQMPNQKYWKKLGIYRKVIISEWVLI